MKKLHVISLILLFAAALVLSSCGGPKKCGGRKGIKTNMGLM
jgi:hypothetical protein